ncbi:hypothetical protein UYO_1211 [Lachnospiraceae bacterium JC7]|nr:hypothetical protein UYO_1211 [Lachnospiraceae bacterium JC7]
MDIIIMNLILVTAIVTLGYYILDAIVSLFLYQSSSIEKNRHKKNKDRSFTFIDVERSTPNNHRTVKRCVNS